MCPRPEQLWQQSLRLYEMLAVLWLRVNDARSLCHPTLDWPRFVTCAIRVRSFLIWYPLSSLRNSCSVFRSYLPPSTIISNSSQIHAHASQLHYLFSPSFNSLSSLCAACTLASIDSSKECGWPTRATSWTKTDSQKMSRRSHQLPTAPQVGVETLQLLLILHWNGDCFNLGQATIAAEFVYIALMPRRPCTPLFLPKL